LLFHLEPSRIIKTVNELQHELSALDPVIEFLYVGARIEIEIGTQLILKVVQENLELCISLVLDRLNSEISSVLYLNAVLIFPKLWVVNNGDYILISVFFPYKPYCFFQLKTRFGVRVDDESVEKNNRFFHVVQTENAVRIGYHEVLRLFTVEIELELDWSIIHCCVFAYFEIPPEKGIQGCRAVLRKGFLTRSDFELYQTFAFFENIEDFSPNYRLSYLVPAVLGKQRYGHVPLAVNEQKNPQLFVGMQQ